MADLQQIFEEAVRLNQGITRFLKASTYFEYDDLSGLDGIDRADGEQIVGDGVLQVHMCFLLFIKHCGDFFSSAK